MVLVGHTRPDKIELEKALHRWAEISWFLDEVALQDVEPGPIGSRPLPNSWRLGFRPNLKQMHHDACTRVSADVVEARLEKEIAGCKSLTSGASATGAKVHKLPDKPRDIEDDGEFHYVILGPRAASESGRPSAEARRFIDEKTGPDYPRVNRNAIVLAVPSVDGIEVARNRIRDYLGWEEVQTQLKGQEIDPIRSEMLDHQIADARKKI